MPLNDLERELHLCANPEKAALLQRFFKTGPGQYGEGDVFLGIMVPQSRILARKYRSLTLPEIKKLLSSKFHEARLIALFILVENFKKGTEEEKKKIYDFYLASTKYINNWDLVDLSAGKIVGAYLYSKPKETLKKLARSKNIWERRIAIIATSYFIGKNEFGPTLLISKMLLHDTHDLLHKAVGWMLREVGKRDTKVLEKFLSLHSHTMPRTTLRYAIERFPEQKRKAYLKNS